MKRALSLILALMFVLALMTGCGGGGNNNQPAGNSGQPPAPAPGNSGNQPASGGQSTESSDSWENEKKVEISFVSQYTTAHTRGALEQFMFDRVYEKTGGTVEFIPYWSSSLFSSSSGWAEVMAGTADGTHIPPFTALDHFKVDPVATMCFASSSLNYKQVMLAMEELYNTMPEYKAEWDGLVPINWDAPGGTMYIMSNVPIQSVDDLKGKSFRVTGTHTGEMLETFGGVAVKMPSGEVLDALSKGIIQGVCSSINNMQDGNYIDVCKYAIALGIPSDPGLNRFIREDRFNEMSAKQKEAFLEAVQDYREECWVRIAAKEQEVLKFCDENGATVIQMPAEDSAKIREVLENIAKREAENLNSMGYDGTGLYETAKMLAEKYKNVT
ncbi:MAG: TRAP transporter substrate-binding protein DctP [Oscillospiraceae bacterium]|nr:TRAP transporter substrate-binding protein DctP [Oscillospiraceae bacterium]